jgi:hypothetical protein
VADSVVDRSTEQWQRDEQLQASAARYLIAGGTDVELLAARLLLACQLQTFERKNVLENEVNVEMRGPRAAYEVFSDYDHPVYQALRAAIVAVLDHDQGLGYLSMRADRVQIDFDGADWRQEMYRELTSGGGLNQARPIEGSRPLLDWAGHRFRSASELRIFQALEDTGALVIPNALARVGLKHRLNKEPDFLVVYKGHTGILEIDGEPWHPPTRTVQDHDRDRLFRFHGVELVEHYDATRCLNHPDEVVKTFLAFLVGRNKDIGGA